MERVFLTYLGHSTELVERETIIGRGLSCQLRLNDPSVSRRHAKIALVDGTATLQDLGSRNGTRLNGEPTVGITRLRHGDLIGIGSRALEVRVDNVDHPFDESTVSQVTYPAPDAKPAPLDQQEAAARQQRCPECKGPVSSDEDRCPHCGYSWADFRPGRITQTIKRLEEPVGRDERRQHPRYQVNVPVLYASENLTIETLALDLSLSGVFVRTQILEEIGTACDLTLMIDGAPALSLHGEVKRVVDRSQAGHPLGLGIEFVSPSPADRAWLDRALARFGVPSV